jgi:hypothetical protein
LHCLNQGCQMVCFQTKNPNLGFLWPFGTFCVHWAHYFWLWYIVPRKSGSPVFNLPLVRVTRQTFIATASGSQDPGFDSQQGVSF